MEESLKIKDIISAIEEFAPLSWQESYDNSGLTLGDKEREVTGCLVCLDVSQAVVDEAIRLGYNMIISHHPLIFKGVKKIDYTSKHSKIIISCIKNDICLYSAHTNIDSALRGVNGILAEKLSLINIEPLNRNNSIDDKNYIGSGLVGYLQEPLGIQDFLSRVKQALSLPLIRHNDNDIKQVRKVAICGGSGSFLIGDAIRQGVDIFLTGDLKHHEIIDNSEAVFLADIGHFESEKFIKERIIAILNEKFCNFARFVSYDNECGVKYF